MEMFASAAPEIRHRAFSDLLDQIAITAEGDAVSFRRVKRMREDVQRWYATRVGWAVIIERDFVRLAKVPATHRETGEFQRLLDPLDYELLVWILWYGEKSTEPVFLLSDLIDEIAAQGNLEREGDPIDWTQRRQRFSFVRAMETLIDLGAMRRYDGDVHAWADTSEGNVLYGFTDLAQRLELATWETDAEDGEIEADPEKRLYRHLLLSPLLHRSRDPKAFALLERRDIRRQVQTEIETHFGWDLLVGEHHAAILRRERSNSRRTFPRADSGSQIALLVCGKVRELLDAGGLDEPVQDQIRLSRMRLEQILVDLREEHERNWPKKVRRLSLEELLQEVSSSMREWGLLHGPDRDGQYYMTPLAARWSAEYTNQEDALTTDEDEG
jgi:succinate dehydrogenase flavin-adding protein (antitoxin of CptAB toxin-antitoxin module)